MARAKSRKRPRHENIEQLSPDDLNPALFVNRELSWLKFNRRVLNEAIDDRIPLLERVRFLGIVASNLDEFFMKRVGRLKSRIAAGFESPSADGLTSSQQLTAIREDVLQLVNEQGECYTKLLRPELLKNGIELLGWNDITDQEREIAKHYYRNNVFPLLTPLAVDPGHPFPFISNLSTSLGVLLRHPDRDEQQFARVKVPRTIPQWILLTSDTQRGKYRYISLRELIQSNLADLFPQVVIVDCMSFRVTRSADLEREEEEGEDMLEIIEQEVYQRRFARVVRLEHGASPNPWVLRFLIEELELVEHDLYEVHQEFDYASLSTLYELNLPQLKYRPWIPATPALLADEETNILTILRNQDLLVHHPYESFVSSVEKFVRTAVQDPKVLAIKMTIYRTGDNSPFMPLLIQAARAGKQVVCVVELTASFDEERNIYWAQALERAGVHVIYGIVGYKTHAKTILVVRQEPEGLRCYAHIGTGNYHINTSNVYTDMGLFTCDQEVTSDLVDLFHYLTGRSLKSQYQKLLVAPLNMKEKMLAMVDRETQNAQRGLPARIIVKVNGFDEHNLCRALYRASQAGVTVDLLVRGPCTLRPGIPGLSENIRVVSVVGRLLEHSRLFYFRNGAENELDGEFYMGSADWLYRNLLTRVEVTAPIKELAHRRKCWEVFSVMLADKRNAWDMLSDGSYRQRVPDQTPESHISCHDKLLALTRQLASGEIKPHIESPDVAALLQAAAPPAVLVPSAAHNQTGLSVADRGELTKSENTEPGGKVIKFNPQL